MRRYHVPVVKKSVPSRAIAGLCIAAATASLYAVFSGPTYEPGDNPGDITGSIVKDERRVGPSGLPIPRFVTLKSGKVNVRRGPGSEYPVAWVYQRKNYPVEITAEFENWRRIRDVDGQEGWILQQMLSGKRYGVTIPAKDQKYVQLKDDAAGASATVALLANGVMSELDECDGLWCTFAANGYEGYIDQSHIWGIYPGEKVD